MFHRTECAVARCGRKNIGQVIHIVASHWRYLVVTTAAALLAAPAMADPLSFKLSYVETNPSSFVTSLDWSSLLDLDNDGDLDWTVGQGNSPKAVYWYEYQKPANTWLKHTLASPSSNLVPNLGGGGATTMDVNGDGRLDIITSPYLFINNGGGNFSAPSDIIPFDATHDLQPFVDMNGDGKVDLLGTHMYRSTSDKGGIYWFQAPATPTSTWTANLINVGVPSTGGYTGIHGATSNKAWGDLNGDGRPDVVGALGWFENTPGTPASGQNGAGWTAHWNTSVFLGVQGTYNVAVRTDVRDLNGDGKLDVVQTECDTNGITRIAWLKNDGLGNFTRNLIKGGTAADYHNLAVADFDKDGDLDIITAAGPISPSLHAFYYFEDTAGPGHDPVYAEHNLSVTLSAADANALSAAFTTDESHQMMVGDVDGDGKMDLVIRGYEGGAGGGTLAPFIFLRNITVPEPSSFGLLGMGALGLLSYGWRRRHAA